MKYSISWMELKTTSTGKTKADCVLIDEAGVEVQKVSIWADFPDFTNLKPGSEVNGDLVRAKDPKYGPTLYPAKTYKTFAVKPKPDMVKIMDKKEASIDKFQDNKELSIKISSTMRMAVDLVIAQNKNLVMTDEGYQDEIKKWRQWLWIEWNKSDKDFPPFN